ncbi:MAG: helix-turn-helix domain-containing protein [Thermoguttaceae bacterium]|jgi:transcriptional regulator with XRE-family HTH domain|nr:helix-turn-helix domain-containing protein [Thermoguttaceae bacterium]
MANLPQENLRRLMTRAGLTIEQLADRAGVDCRSIRGILDGSNRPHARTLHRLAEGLGVDADEFFLDPVRLLYRRLDRQTNPLVAEILQAHPELTEGWTAADFDELHSRFGTGGGLTADGALETIHRMNRNRSLHERLAVLLETSQRELIGKLIDAFYEQALVSGDDRPLHQDG